jgi:HSP20 family protein
MTESTRTEPINGNREHGAPQCESLRLADAERGLHTKREKEVGKQMLSPYRGRGFYDPLSEMNRLFAQVFGLTRNQGGSNQPQQGADQGGQATQEITAWAPAIDVVQRDEDLVVRAELPGVTPDEVDITIQNNVLTISGRISEEKEEEREGYLVRERRTGIFRRSLQLPQEVDEDDISARFEDGVLEVVIQGAAAGQEPKHVQVESSDGGGGRSQQEEEGNGAQQR